MSEGKKAYHTTAQRIIELYKDQLQKFYKLGIGNETEFRTTITQTLIDCTKRRLKQLTKNHAKWLRNNSLPEFRRDE